MSEQTKYKIIFYLENISLAIIMVLLLFLPNFFLSASTDAFILPKQILLASAVSITTILFGIKTILEGKIKFRTTPFDIPILLLIVSAMVSSLLSVNRSDSLIAFLPFFFITLLFFNISNTIKTPNQLLLILLSLTLGAVLSSILSIFSWFGIYPLPFPFTHEASFNTFGSLLDQAIYFALVLPITGYFVHAVFSELHLKKSSPSPFVKNHNAAKSKVSPVSVAFTISFIIILTALSTTVYQLATTQKPLILPIETGFQTAFSSISQDSGRVLWGFLFGSGPGTYVTDFTRFKPVSYNLNNSLWSFTFFRSSTYILELLATIGIAGLLSFLFLIIRIVKERSPFLPIILGILAAIILPFSFTLVALFFILVGIFAVTQAHNQPERYNEIELYFVALKRGLLAARIDNPSESHSSKNHKYSMALPILFLIITLLIVGFPLYYLSKFFISDLIYQRSIIAFSQNNGQLTYDQQINSINTYPFRDLYHRGFSQTNLALANALAAQLQNNQNPSEQDQQNIVILIQQAIAHGKNAILLSPQTAFNWSNLSNIYRDLIGYGEGAENFAIETIQRAIELDPKNPLLYVDLGGIYYQVGQYDDAIRQFQLAISLKEGYANAYYNLGHALEMKGNLQEALAAYQIVRSLVANDPENVSKIDQEIEIVQTKINNSGNTFQPIQPEDPSATTSAEVTNQDEKDARLKVNDSSNLSEIEDKIEIPDPTISPPDEEESPTPTESDTKSKKKNN